jgi:glycerol-3-phosphate dehydrogenase (NAD(P)+)
VVGAGSFGTAVAVLLARGGFRTTLQTRTREQCRLLDADRENKAYLPGVALPRDLRIEPASEGLARADYVFLGVPSRGLEEVIQGLEAAGPGPPHAGRLARQGPRAARRDRPDRDALGRARLRPGRLRGRPAHAREMVTEGAGLVAASLDERLAGTIANVFMRAGVVCEQSSDPIGVELAGVAKNAAALAAGATEASGLNAAGAGRRAHLPGGLALRRAPGRAAGVADRAGRARATSSAPRWRPRAATAARASCSARACRRTRSRTGSARPVEALDMVPLLAAALDRAGVEAPSPTRCGG